MRYADAGINDRAMALLPARSSYHPGEKTGHVPLRHNTIT